jgi:UDP-N-acetylmuramoyl-tripeptide--D-alanyl-D-alanine ligase
MFPIKASEIASITGGNLINGPEEMAIKNVSLNTRTLRRGDLFIPLKGEKFDGHKFIADALLRGACGFLSEHWNDEIKKSLGGHFRRSTMAIIVEDTLLALHALAKYIRGKLDVEVIGITGSTGKTCTKDMISNVLSQEFNIVSTEKNYNNEIGVPLTVLKADQKTQFLVVEMAMRGLGQIHELTEIVHPKIGLITNVGKTHFELLGSEEKIAEAKSELIRAIPSDGVIILNADDKWSENLRKLARAPVVTYGISKTAHIRAEDIKVDVLGRPSFKMISDKNVLSLDLPFPGRHNIYNALATYAVASELGLSQASVKKGLETCVFSEMRMQVFTTPDGITVLNDAYNANPTSMKAALVTLGDMAEKKRKLAVLGDMLELGTLAEMAHFEIGELVKDLNVDLLITVGSKSKRIVEGALSKGMNSRLIFQCQTTEEAAKVLVEKVKPGDVILVKASRAMELERVINVLL